jgi:predicted RNase H-like nuclease (RuvC/YqgF family)
MQLLLSLITSGSIKWLSILIIVGGLADGIYSKFEQLIELEKKTTLQEYNIKQLEQSLKDKDKFIEEQQIIYKNKDEEITKLESQKSALNNKLKTIESDIDVEVEKGNDRSSSDILKQTIRKLGK